MGQWICSQPMALVECPCAAEQEAIDNEWSSMWSGFGSPHVNDPWIISMIKIATFAMLD